MSGGGFLFLQVKREELQGHYSENEKHVPCSLGWRRGMHSEPCLGNLKIRDALTIGAKANFGAAL